MAKQKKSTYANKRESSHSPQWQPPKPLNNKQKEYIDLISSNAVVVATGLPGTAKTYIPAALGAYWLATGKIDKVILARPNEALGKTVGLLPGTADEKLAPLVAPAVEAMKSILGQTQFDYLHKKGSIEFCLLELVKGRTFDNSLILVDESEDLDMATMKSILTRIGMDSHLVISGDVKQQSLKGKSGINLALELSKIVDGIKTIEFGEEEIVRSGICRDIVIGLSKLGYY